MSGPGSGRECGDCQVCCELPAVKSLKKPMFTVCENQCAQGCAIYESRPKECRDFHCAWLRGDAALEEEDRPDKLGILLETCLSSVPNGDSIRYVHAWEVSPNALEEGSERALEIVNRLSDLWPVKLQRYNQPAAYGPTDPEARADLRELAIELQRRDQVRPEALRVGRNEPCPCGSGRKYKKCHGATR